jgi:hypothetical protein
MNLLLSTVAASTMFVTFAGITFAQSAGSDKQKYPDVVNVSARAHGENSFDFDVTISSLYDTAERYANAFRVMGTDGKSYGERILFHDHADEQPFTRDLYNVSIPRGVQKVIVQARDKKYGYGGKTKEVVLPGR